jgi:hypothetical protein
MSVSPGDARAAGEALGVNWDVVPLDQWQEGLRVELEHGTALGPEHAKVVDVTGDDLVATGRIALAHFIEDPDYYRRLAAMEAESEAFWEGREKPLPYHPPVNSSATLLKKVAVLVALIVLVIVLAWYMRWCRGGHGCQPSSASAK